jgi:hypothetical protein
MVKDVGHYLRSIAHIITELRQSRGIAGNNIEDGIMVDIVIPWI